MSYLHKKVHKIAVLKSILSINECIKKYLYLYSIYILIFMIGQYSYSNTLLSIHPMSGLYGKSTSWQENKRFISYFIFILTVIIKTP